MRKINLLFIPLILILFAFKTNYWHTITGIITDDKSAPITHATVQVKGTNIATTTDKDGKYSINAADAKGSLVISAVGFNTVVEKIKGRNIINVNLQPTLEALQEVVVTGFGAQRKMARDMVVQGYVPGLAVGKSNGFYSQDFNTEDYDNITENGFLKVADNPLSTFSIDVDAASYSNVRRFINNNQLPPAGAVRTEELVNYFTYSYNQPKDDQPFSINTEISDCPWNQDHRLVMVGLQGKKIPVDNLPPSNLVFLIDVSGSMESEAKLPLVKSSLKLLVDQLREQDKVAIVVYAGAAGLVLPSTNGNEKTKIKEAIENLSAGGSTAGGAGIKLAYKIAKENFNKEGNNRVILCTDGDFNVGVSSDDDLERMIEKERETGVYLTVLGYGMGNYKDNKMQKLADKGNGNHAYIDGISEAKKVLVNEFGGTLFTIAKDVKLQVEFNPAKVQGYRLIGYENRMLKKEDFNDDKKDAGELGSGHTVTALYEVIPVGVESEFIKDVDDLKYQKNKTALSSNAKTNEIMTIKFRYKSLGTDVSRLIEHAVLDNGIKINNTSDNFRFAASVAQFGMLLRNSEFKGSANYQSILKLATNAKGSDAEGYRKEFISLLKKVSALSNKSNQYNDVTFDANEER